MSGAAPSAAISTHALREEGDPYVKTFLRPFLDFYPRPPRGGRRLDQKQEAYIWRISTHALREEGDADCADNDGGRRRGFLPTPSARRATRSKMAYALEENISTHALREEGDLWMLSWKFRRVYFYPRPPRGGRRLPFGALCVSVGFLPTPSARRATPYVKTFLRRFWISTHALREEGDDWSNPRLVLPSPFLPTPSARRATAKILHHGGWEEISTHALREEGDADVLVVRDSRQCGFLPTPSARRATGIKKGIIMGDPFLPTPSARRATSLQR